MSGVEESTGKGGEATSFTAEERAAMKQRAAELKAEAKRGKGAAKAEADAEDVRKTIAELPEPDRSVAERLHTVVTTAAPELAPRLWYGMPAYAKDGKVLCYFTPASKFKERYATFGFNAVANLDEGNFWPTSFALTELGEAEEAAIDALVRRAVS